MNNKDLIERLRYPVGASKTTISEAADALEAADKRIAEEREQHDIMMERGAEKLAEAERRIAELEKEAQFNFEQYQDAGRLLCEANEKLAVAWMALKWIDDKYYASPESRVLVAQKALAQIGENK